MKVWGFLLRWGTAGIAAAVSAAFAATLSSIESVTYVLVALSIACVVIEAHSLGWARARQLEGDRLGANLCMALLIMACVYTGGMQLGFFGNVLMAPAAHDKGAAASLASAEKHVIELEQRAGWLVRPAGSVSSLSAMVDKLEAKKKLSTKDADQLRQARVDLAAAQGVLDHDKALATARAEVAKLKGEAPKDVKGQVFEWLTRGLMKGDAVTFSFILLAVVVMQFAQIVLPIVTGAHAAKRPQMVPKAAQVVPDVEFHTPRLDYQLGASGVATLGAPQLPPAPLAITHPAPVAAKGPAAPQPKPLAAKSFKARVAEAKRKPPRGKPARKAAQRKAEPPPFDLPANVAVLRPNSPGLRGMIKRVG